VGLEHPVYRLALDSRRGRLYAATSLRHFLQINPFGEREDARGDLHVYDVRALLRGEEAPHGQTLRPKAKLGLVAHFHGLALAPGGEHLYYQASSRGEAHLARIDCTNFSADRRFGLGTGTGGIALSPDGKHLHALTSPFLRMIDTAAWTERKALRLLGGEYTLAAGNNGRVYLAERREPPQVYALDMPQGTVVGRWSAAVRGRVSLRLDAGRDRLFLATTALAGGRIWALDVAGDRVKAPGLTAEVVSDRAGVLRGGLFLTPDGQYVLNGSGRIFRVGPG
jgi:hypothetical protein